MAAKRVVFVCTGNICRSPTAEALLRHHGADLPIEVDSCGVSREEEGNPPHPLAVAELRRRGIAPPVGRARQVRGDDHRSALWLVAMTRGHEKALVHARPRDAVAEIRTLSSFDPTLGGIDVPDPWYAGTRAAFAEAFDLIERGVVAMLPELRARLG
jgi:protein-tyrosine phosphatase